MIVTDKKYYMDEHLVEKLNLCAKRCMKKDMDSLLIVDGDEGLGKTTISSAAAYYVKSITNMGFNTKSLFFDVDEMIDFAAKTEKQIIIWDEAALSGLSMEWYNKSQVKLIKFLMVSRKKNHFYFFNIPKIFRLKDYLAIERSLGLIHVYSPDELRRGNFAYFRKDPKERLYHEWGRLKFKHYKKHYDFRGKFIDNLNKIVKMQDYDKMKDNMIAKIGKEKQKTPSKRDIKFTMTKQKIYELPKVFPGITYTKLAEHFNIGISTLSEWNKPQISVTV